MPSVLSSGRPLSLSSDSRPSCSDFFSLFLISHRTTRPVLLLSLPERPYIDRTSIIADSPASIGRRSLSTEETTTRAFTAAPTAAEQRQQHQCQHQSSLHPSPHCCACGTEVSAEELLTRLNLIACCAGPARCYSSAFCCSALAVRETRRAGKATSGKERP